MDSRIIFVCFVMVGVCCSFQISNKIRLPNKPGQARRNTRVTVNIGPTQPSRYQSLTHRPAQKNGFQHRISINGLPSSGSGFKIIKHTIVIKQKPTVIGNRRSNPRNNQRGQGHGRRRGSTGRRGQGNNSGFRPGQPAGGNMGHGYPPVRGNGMSGRSFGGAQNGQRGSGLHNGVGSRFNGGHRGAGSRSSGGNMGYLVQRMVGNIRGGSSGPITFVDQRGVPHIALPLINLGINGTAIPIVTSTLNGNVVLSSNRQNSNAKQVSIPGQLNGAGLGKGPVKVVTVTLPTPPTTLAPTEEPPEVSEAEAIESEV